MKPRIPQATYRLQLSPHFTFEKATALCPYLEALGITDIYTSPFMAGGPEDLNGYQVTDHRQVNPKLGAEAGLQQMTAELKSRGMGLIADVVPNHMCIASADNAWWNDILEYGQSSPYARYFDIDWDPPRAELKNQVLLPILVDQFGRVLEQGDLQVVVSNGSFHLSYLGRCLPMNPNSYEAILDPLANLLDPSDPFYDELQSILTAVRHLPSPLVMDPQARKERIREAQVIKHRLDALLGASEEMCAGLDEVLSSLNGLPGDPASFDALDQLLHHQAYRLSFWRVANHEINYRRFFDVNDLAGLCVEHPEVFSAVHERIFGLVAEGQVTGLRVDHIDGLFDPQAYLEQVRQTTDCYLVVEKIFTGAERLRKSWPIQGTTGYDFLNLLNGLFVYQKKRSALRNVYFDFGGWHQDAYHLIYSCKRYALSVALASEWHVLARHLDRVSEQNRFSRDFTLESLQQVLREVIACFPVYRSYIRPHGDDLTDEDRTLVVEAIRRARRFNPTTSPLIYDFVQCVLLHDDPSGLTQEQLEDRRLFVTRFQQLTGPVMAKGVEDTAFYRCYPLVSLNEVGGDPYAFGTSVDAFHRENGARCAHWPHAMTTTSTHDTKRSEDVRARINVLSEIPDRWEQALVRWRQANEPLKVELDGELVPGGNEEYLFYQTVLGAYPLTPPDPALFIERMQTYMEKATKEAKVYTSWVNPNQAYDHRLATFIEHALDPEGPFLADLHTFLPQVVRPGLCNSLAQVVMKLASPGVPDFYQGCELWDFSLVDPDNRRPIDYSRHPELLASVRKQPGKELVNRLWAAPEDGRLKLYVTTHGLHARKRLPELFARGSYTSVKTAGTYADNVIGFVRSHQEQVIVAAVGRFFTQFGGDPLGEAWKETALLLPKGEYRDLFTQEVHSCNTEVPVSALFADLPVTLLERVS